MIRPCNYQPHSVSILPEVTVRKMVQQDIPHFCTLFQDVFSQEPWNEHWSIEVINKLITSQMQKKGFTGFTACTTSGIIGYFTGYSVRFLPSVFYIDQLFIDPQYQGQKTGSKLLSESVQNLKRAGITRFLLLTIPGSYSDIFYVKNDFKPLFPLIRIRDKSFFYKSIKKER